MGQVLCALIENSKKHTLAAKVSLEFDTDESRNIYKSLEECNCEADCVIDFSNHLATNTVVTYAVENKLPLVIATTGQTAQETEMIRDASKKIPLFYSQNMSLSVAILSCLAKIAAKALPECDIEIIEKHHNLKLDAPSGTALALADSVNEELGNAYTYVYDRSQRREKRDAREIGISAVRGGTIVGEHDVIFAGTDEVITFSHGAYSKSVFAKGAVEAAKFLAGKQAGMYNMSNVIDSIL